MSVCRWESGDLVWLFNAPRLGQSQTTRVLNECTTQALSQSGEMPYYSIASDLCCECLFMCCAQLIPNQQPEKQKRKSINKKKTKLRS